ncbi:hypothetical protein QQY66_18470 [Streptomyces sp. DG2A-72]|uniref:hypothetical protein n=1 Tax=Streptomyces sp. DG2A-72 TaxID=3051386 RepID=UPI00265C0315|nr:hypothetical protein [Streptomyces sp. DG2A-72]MDO0933569.1 hypothetical protein [Streptomyces sp. DG2A-72]
MNDRSREVTAADIAQLLRGIEKAAQRVGYSLDQVLDVTAITTATGVGPDRVRALLGGAEPQQPPRESKARVEFYRQMVSQRLDLLRKRRADSSSPEGDSYRRIAEELGLAHTLIGFLVKGQRSAREEYSRPLERFYGVEHGFLSKLEGEALADELEKIKTALLASALRQGFLALGGEQAALRHSGGEPVTMEDLVAALDDLMARKGIPHPTEDGDR